MTTEVQEGMSRREGRRVSDSVNGVGRHRSSKYICIIHHLYPVHYHVNKFEEESCHLRNKIYKHAQARRAIGYQKFKLRLKIIF